MLKKIFVSGIHGVGKTTYCSKLSKEIGLEFYSASRLILAQTEKYDRDKRVVNVRKNQDILINAIKDLNLESFILDGHFILVDSEDQMIKVPISTFESLNLTEIIILTDSVENIQLKLENRDNIKYNLDTLEKMQSMELNRAKEISQRLSIPIKEIKLNSKNIK